MLHALAPLFIAVAAVAGWLPLAGRDPRHGRGMAVLAVVCLACLVLGAVGVMT